MKAGQFKSWVKSPQVHKWSLFGLLALSLGFNLSMNPEYFNNIARIEKPEAFQYSELASSNATGTAGKTAAPAVGQSTSTATPPTTTTTLAGSGTVTTVTPPGTPVATVPATPVTSQVSFANMGKNKNEIYNAKFEHFVSDKDGKPRVLVTVTAASNCTDCNKHSPTYSYVFDSNINDLNNLIPVLNERLNETLGANRESKKETAEGKWEAKLAEMAKKCDDKKDAKDTFKCHQENLIKLQKDLKDAENGRELLTKYFDENLKGTLESNLNSPTFNIFGDNSDAGEDLYSSKELVAELMGKINEKIGVDVRKSLAKLLAQSYLAQIKNSQKLIRLGQQTLNPDLVRLGMSSMSAPILMTDFNNDLRNLTDNLHSTDRKALLMSFANPVSQWIGQAQQLSLASLPKGVKTYADLYSTYRFRDLGMERDLLAGDNFNPLSGRGHFGRGQGRRSALLDSFDGYDDGDFFPGNRTRLGRRSLPGRSSLWNDDVRYRNENILAGRSRGTRSGLNNPMTTLSRGTSTGAGRCNYSPVDPARYSLANQCGRRIGTGLGLSGRIISN